ncbi:MAG: hypothetical protein Q9M39_05465 [Sulfurovum sp.]|nr:hypothetical protein [Sulfurovum sp.]
MQIYIRLVFNLLIPLILLFTVLSIGYFTFDYNFSKAFQLGILSGVLIGVSMSLPLALIRLISNVIRTPKTYEDEEVIVPLETLVITKENNLPEEIKCMLLMDRELAFDVTLNTLKNNSTCTLVKSDPKKGTMRIQTTEGIIEISITSLTRHTSRIILQAIDNVTHVKHLISKVKEKEHAFLQY